ncbi:hypothetical protein BGZ80_000582 [Entomortierella chlamydospora]|uniref:F-box domain-containing protein n=1 Tax=Entomortierella chlamydospora TaxID=101097 RepID=A0A9P6SYX3_9FUNG|nr:hypothetical protein BGZ80_000582 [Entomortierella chlamydospora]
MGNTQSISYRRKKLPLKKRHSGETSENLVPVQPLDGAALLDKLPPEIWHLVFSFLYPSELARASQVCQKFYHTIFSLQIWASIQKVALYRDGPVKLLANVPTLTSYALFVFANSLQICEQCFRKCDGISSTSSSTGWRGDNLLDFDIERETLGLSVGLSAMPLPVLLPWTKSGIRLCQQCRRQHFDCYPEPIPPAFKGKRLRRKDIRNRLHLCDEEILQLKRFGCGATAFSFCAEDALRTARIIYGGDVGIAAVGSSLSELLDRSKFRVYAYQNKWDILNEGETWKCIAP